MSKLCDDCFKGVTHVGTPTGNIQTLGSKLKIQCYVATPTGEFDTSKVVLFFPDAFGMQLINNQLLADDFAKNGFKTVIIDYFEGDTVPIDYKTLGETFDREGWFKKHVAPKSDPSETTIDNMIESVMDALKAEGITRFGTSGYCFGGRYVLWFARRGLTHVSVTAHPSFIKVPEDLELYAAESKAPLLLNTCTVDEQFPLEAQAAADQILGNGKFPHGYEKYYWDGCTHGFAVRGDMNDPKVKAGKEGSFEKSVEFFKKYL